MRNDCEIIKDLLPSYVDGLTSQESNQYIKEHISDCDDCKTYLNYMQSASDKIKKENKITIDYMKKIKKKNSLKILYSILSIFALLTISFITYSLWPSRINGIDDIKYGFISEGPNYYILKIINPEPNKGIKIKEKKVKDGLNLEVFSTNNTLFNDDSIEIKIDKSKNTNIYINGYYVVNDKIFIPREISKYHYNMSKDIKNEDKTSNFINNLGFGDFGKYSFEINNKIQPYGVKLTIDSPNINTDFLLQELQGKAAIFLKLVENSEYFDIHFQAENRKGNFRVDKEYVKFSYPKEFDNPYNLRKFMDNKEIRYNWLPDF